MGRLENYPGLTKEDIGKLNMTRFHLISTRGDAPGLIATYPPSSEDDPGETCPYCGQASYYHASMFAFADYKRVGGTICLSCVDVLEAELGGKEPDEIETMERYCRENFGDDLFDKWIIYD